MFSRTHAQQSHSHTSELLKELKVDTSKSLDEIKDGVASLQSQISLADAQSVRQLYLHSVRGD